MNLSKLVKEAHATAELKGWHDDYEVEVDALGITERITPRQKLALVCLFTDECDEADVEEENEDGLSDDLVMERYDENGKPLGIVSEYADALIRMADFAGVTGWSLESDGNQSFSIPRARTNLVSAIRKGDEALQQLWFPRLFCAIIDDFFGRYDSRNRLFKMVETKMAFNATRSRRHGGKLA